jgi:formylglycine-generating enzyme required for sulfatase activity
MSGKALILAALLLCGMMAQGQETEDGKKYLKDINNCLSKGDCKCARDYYDAYKIWESSNADIERRIRECEASKSTGSSGSTTPKTASGSNYTESVSGVSIDMVYVRGGTFTMGCTPEQGSDCESDEKPAHQVTVSDFYIGKYEVTQAQWKAVTGNNPSNFKGDNLPVEQVSWDDVQTFISKLNAQTGKKYRLLTEAEWEYAARGGASSRGYKYSGSNMADQVAWYYENSGDKALKDSKREFDNLSNNHCRSHPVGTKAANELGIYDMSGNVYEWCSDWSCAYSSSSQTNPAGPSSGSGRVLRGGSWNNFARDCRSAYRFSLSPAYHGNDVGFRLASSL